VRQERTAFLVRGMEGLSAEQQGVLAAAVPVLEQLADEVSAEADGRR
jgi:hypothetical protein